MHAAPVQQGPLPKDAIFAKGTSENDYRPRRYLPEDARSAQRRCFSSRFGPSIRLAVHQHQWSQKLLLVLALVLRPPPKRLRRPGDGLLVAVAATSRRPGIGQQIDRLMVTGTLTDYLTFAYFEMGDQLPDADLDNGAVTMDEALSGHGQTRHRRRSAVAPNPPGRPSTLAPQRNLDDRNGTAGTPACPPCANRHNHHLHGAHSSGHP